MHQRKGSIWKRAIALTVAGLMALPGLASAATVDEIVAKHIEATGGRAAQEAVKSVILRGEANIVNFGFQAEFVVHFKNGNFKRTVEIPGIGQMVEAVTGDVAWRMNPIEGHSILEGNEAEHLRDQANFEPLLNWKETYESAEVTGEENGATTVVFGSHSGTKTTNYFDNASGLLTKQVRKDATGNSQTTIFSDYKKVGEITLPHLLVIQSIEVHTAITVATTELNAEIDDSTFDLPEAIKAQLSDEQS